MGRKMDYRYPRRAYADHMSSPGYYLDQTEGWVKREIFIKIKKKKDKKPSSLSGCASWGDRKAIAEYFKLLPNGEYENQSIDFHYMRIWLRDKFPELTKAFK